VDFILLKNRNPIPIEVKSSIKNGFCLDSLPFTPTSILQHVSYVLSRLTNGSSRQKEFHLKSLTEPYVNLSIHTALIIQSRTDFVVCTSSSHFRLTMFKQLNDVAPSLRIHYRYFIATTSYSATVFCFGTQPLAGPPLGVLPYHQNDSFSRSTQKPVSSSRHLYAGYRLSSMQVHLRLILKNSAYPQFW